MEPPDAWAEMRRAPQLLVLVLLLGAHPGMPGWEQGAREPRGLKGKGTFTHPWKPNLRTPGRRGMGACGASLPVRSEDSQAEELGSTAHHSAGQRPPEKSEPLPFQRRSGTAAPFSLPLDLGPRPSAPSDPEVQASGGWNGFLPGPRRPQPRAPLLKESKVLRGPESYS